MVSSNVQDAIAEVVESADFRPLFEHLADDVELRVAVAASPVTHERRGRQRVLDYFANADKSGIVPVERSPDLFASGDRIVAFVDGSVPLGTGVTIRSGCALVFDVRDGAIARLGIHYELSPEVDSRAIRTLAAQDGQVIATASRGDGTTESTSTR